jgi:hypothetical protein
MPDPDPSRNRDDARAPPTDPDADTDSAPAPARDGEHVPTPGVAGPEFGSDGADEDVGLGRHLFATAAYVVVVIVAATVTTVAIGYATGRGLVGAKWGLFVLGTLLLGYGSLRLRSAITPAERGRQGDDRPGLDLDLDALPVVGGLVGDSGDADGSRGFVAVADRLTPATLRVPPGAAWPVGLKQLVAAVGLFVVSFVLERVLGVAA